jgi:hypothetical protein
MRTFKKLRFLNYLDCSSAVRILDQEICFFCGLRFEPCDCSYDDH